MPVCLRAFDSYDQALAAVKVARSKCEELGLPMDVTTVDFSPAYRAAPEWHAISPIAKVPVRTDGALVPYWRTLTARPVYQRAFGS